MKRAIVFLVFLTLSIAGCSRYFASRQQFHLYILAGQSNMAGRGQVGPQDAEPHPRVFVLDREGQWRPAVEPLHFDKPGMVGVGPGLAFGKAMAQQKPNVTIGLIPCAAGGSPVSTWTSGGYHAQTKSYPYDDAIQRARIGRTTGVIKGILWHQGESDSTEDRAQVYQAKLMTVIEDFRRDLGDESLPFIVGQLGDFVVAQNPNAEIINNILQSLPQTVANTGCVDAGGLTPKSDNIHFDTESARILGRRYAQKMLILER